MMLFAFFLLGVNAQSNPAGLKPMSACFLGKMTNTDTSDLWQGKCNYGPNNPLMIPKWGGVYGTNQNEYNGPGYLGFRDGAACGECYQISGPAGSARLMVIAGGGGDFDSFGPDDKDVPHFEVTTDVYKVVSGGQSGLGWLTITMRKVACDFEGTTIKMQVLDKSDATYIMMMFQFHTVGMNNTILVQESGTTTWTPVTRDPYNRFIHKHQTGSGTKLPLKIQIFSINQEKIEFTLPDVVPLKVYDTGAQFALPPDGYGGSSTTCPNGCSLTLCNNGLKYIMNQGVFMPQNTGFWTTPAIMKSTNQIWENYGRSATKDSADPFAGQYSAKIDNVAAYGTIVNIGCNIASPISQVTAIEFQAKASVNTVGINVKIDDNNGNGPMTSIDS